MLIASEAGDATAGDHDHDSDNSRHDGPAAHESPDPTHIVHHGLLQSAPASAAVAVASTAVASSSVPPPDDMDLRSARNDATIEAEIGAGLGLNISEGPEVKPQMSNLFRILSYGNKLDYSLMAVGIVASIGSGVTLPLMNIVFGNLSGSFTQHFTPDMVSSISPEQVLEYQNEFKRNINKQTLYLVYLFIARFFLSYLSLVTFRVSGIRVSAKLRLAYLEALFEQPIAVFDALPSGKVATRITSSANTIQLGCSDKLSVFVTFASLFVAAFAVSFARNWLLTFVCCSIIPVIIIAYSLTVPPFVALQKKVEEVDDKASSLAGEIFGSVRTVIAFGAQEKLGHQYSKIIDESRKQGLKVAPLLGAQFSPIFFALYCGFAITFWFGIRQYSRGDIDSVATVVTVLFSVMMAIMSLGQIADPLQAMGKAASASSALFQTIDAPKPKTTGLSSPEASAMEDIVFEDVDFYYPSRPNVKVLDKLNVRFEANKITAIVGPSGSGKSTIVGLLERWYTLKDPELIRQYIEVIKETNKSDKADKATLKAAAKAEKAAKKAKKASSKRAEQPIEHLAEKPEHDVSEESLAKPKEPEKEDPLSQLKDNGGRIMVGGHELLDLDQRWWRQQIGLVQQEPFLFNDTIFKNVAHGLIGTQYEYVSDEEKMKLVKEACHEAFASEFIERLHEGYDTKVGESGLKLSGGQRQRLAIARSIVSRPPILILDEATSAIDVRSERIVQDALDKVSQNRTTIVIAHRLSTIKKADKIVVMRKGNIAEEGTHESLVAKEDGVYAKLVKAQSIAMQKRVEDPEKRDSEDDLVRPAPLEKKSSNVMQRLRSAGRSSTKRSIALEEAGEEPQYKKKSITASILTLLYEQRGRWPLYLLLIFAAVGAGGAYPVQAIFFAEIINAFSASRADAPGKGNFWAGMFVVLAGWVLVIYFLLGFATTSLGVRMSTFYRNQYFNRILSKRIPFFDRDENSPGTLVSRVQTDPKQIQELLGGNSAMLLVALVNIVAGTVLGFAVGWKLSLVAFFAALPVVYGAGLLRVKHEVKYEAMNNAVFADSAQFATEAVGAFRTVSSLTLEKTICNRYETLLTKHQRDAFHKSKWSGIVFAASDSVEFLAMALTFWYGSRLLADGVYSVRQFFIIYTAIVQGGQAAGSFSAFAPNIAQAGAAANRILSLRYKDEVDHPKQGYTHLDKERTDASIEFRDVTFHYPSRPNPVYKNLNLKIESGQFAALVGPSGCGKTTVVSLIERFYEIDSGQILFNDVPVSEIETAELRSLMSLVAQEPTLYQGTIRENITLGIDTSKISDSEIIAATKAAEMHTFITSLPDSYNTQVGSKGVSLSGGQKQRIAIARALIRKPRVLLLDEATSSLDGESEKLIQAALERAAEGRTMVVVAHRLATIQKADIIFVFGDGGQLVEQGSHEELLDRRGAYWSMCQSQALDR